MELQSRRIVHAPVTHSPTDDWTAQLIARSDALGRGSKLSHLRPDNKYGTLFLNVAKARVSSAEDTSSSTKANAIWRTLHRWFGRECLDSHVHPAFPSVAAHCSGVRGLLQPLQAHQGIGQRVPAQYPGDIPHHQAKSSPRRCWVAYTMPTPVPLLCTDI